MKELLRLFNAVLVEEKKEVPIPDMLERGIKNGYILDPSIDPSDKLLDIIESVVGRSGEKANASFHKSWKTIKDAPIEQLVIQQTMHYMTTYGFDALGIYTEDTVYIPSEELDIPNITEGFSLVVIKAMTSDEMLSKLIELWSGIALSPETLRDVVAVVKANKYSKDIVQTVKNRELKAMLSDHFGIVPTDPVEFLRHMVSKLTDESLIIKNEYLIHQIKKSNGKFLDELLKAAPDNLASIFYRYKPLFLAMKSISNNKTFFNRLRKRATKLHVPLGEDYLNTVTDQLKNGKLSIDVLKEKLKRVSVFRKIRLAYAVLHRSSPGREIVYKVRNGKGWATYHDWPENLNLMSTMVLNVVVDSIASDVRKNVEDKTIYIPPNLYYALPATEKQFTGNLPTGTYVAIPEDLIVGIHWKNTDKRVDLDLSVIGESGKIGWDVAHRNEERSVLFSGDMTDAPGKNGASELLYLKNAAHEARILCVNYYNFDPGDQVECKIIAAWEKPKKFGMNYMVDVNNIVASATVNISKKQNILGLIVNVDGENRVYFSSVSIGNSITASQNEWSTITRKYLVQSSLGALDFRNILYLAGASVVDEKPDREHIDLSIEAMDKTTIINMINKKTPIKTYNNEELHYTA